MSYKIAIPSYKRANILQSKTLSMLNLLGIDKELINVFIVDDEYDTYNSICDKNLYNQLIIGNKGLVEQREFIQNFYDDGQYIIFLDDDIDMLDLSLTNYSSAHDFFVDAFRICVRENAFIWSIYPVFNTFFRTTKKPMTTCLNYMIGAFYGIINRRNCNDLFLTLSVNGNKEDVERSIKYFIKDGITIRFNKIGFKTKYYGTDGGGLGTFNQRLEFMKQATTALNKEYPNLTKIKIRKNGLYEIVLRRL